jgi:hypothetical protein
VNVAAIGKYLSERLLTVVETTYERPSAQPVFPCAVVEFPDVVAFHNNMAHSMTRLEYHVSLYEGRGEHDSAIDALSKYVSTDTPESVMVALEAKVADRPLSRVAVESCGEFRDEGDAFAVTFIVSIDA